MNAQRLVLLAGGLLVLGLVLGLVYALRADGPPRAPITAVSPPARPGPSPEDAAAQPSRPLAAPDGPSSGSTAPPARLEPDETVDDQGRVIRDHRGLGAAAPPNPFVPGTIATARQAVNLSMRACVPGPGLALDAPVRVTVHSTMRSRGGRLTAAEVSLDGADALGPDYAACVRRAFEGLNSDAPGEQPDAEERVHMPFTVP